MFVHRKSWYDVAIVALEKSILPVHYHQRYILRALCYFHKISCTLKHVQTPMSREKASHLTLHIIFSGWESRFIKNAVCNRYV